MLVLTRKNGQKIQIGDQITITIVRVKGKSVRVGIDAPEDVRIVRSELPPRLGDVDTPESELCEIEVPGERSRRIDMDTSGETCVCRPNDSDAASRPAPIGACHPQRPRNWSSGSRGTATVRLPMQMGPSVLGSLSIR